MGREVLLVVAILLYIAALGLLFAGMGTPHWSELGGERGYHDGLWISCDERGCRRQNLEDVTNAFRCSVAFMILAILFCVTAGCCMLFSYILCGFIEIITGLCGLVSILAWVSSQEQMADGSSVGYSWVLTLMGSLLYLPSACLFLIVSRSQESKPNKKVNHWTNVCMTSGMVTLGIIIASVLMYLTILVISVGKMAITHRF